MKRYIFLVSLFALFVSCSKNTNDIQTEQLSDNKTITINLKQNIQSIDPKNATNVSEKLIRDLTYDNLLKWESSGKFESKFIKSIVYDTLMKMYSFELFADITFHNGHKFESSDIEYLFTTLWKRQNEFGLIPFFSVIEGYSFSNNTLNQSNMTAFPKGIAINDSHHFTIQLTRYSENFLSWMTTNAFLIHHENTGSGSFRLIDVNDDISTTLSRINESSDKISSIQLRFIKNRKEEVSQFLNNELDMIVYNPLINRDIENMVLHKIFENKYSGYQIIKSNHAIVEYCKIYNVKDSATLEFILNQPPFLNQNKYMLAANYQLESSIATDTINISNILFWDNRSINKSKLSFSNHFNELNDSIIDRNTPYFVLEEGETFIYDGIDAHTMEELIEKTDELNNSYILTPLKIYPSVYITESNMKGISDYMSLHQVLESVSIQKPSIY
ncbi:MAG: hypothetical protein JXR07_07905 [Reichenbachiella sp.]